MDPQRVQGTIYNRNELVLRGFRESFSGGFVVNRFKPGKRDFKLARVTDFKLVRCRIMVIIVLRNLKRIIMYLL